MSTMPRANNGTRDSVYTRVTQHLRVRADSTHTRARTSEMYYTSTVDPKDKKLYSCAVVSVVCHTKWCIVDGYVHTAKLAGVK